jgi:hypothetical protein
MERSRQKLDMLQGYGDTVLWAESLEKELNKARKHSAMLQSKLDGATRDAGEKRRLDPEEQVVAPEEQR